LCYDNKNDWRQKGDYDNIFDYNEESVKPMFDKVFEMISLIQQHITSS